MKKIAFGIFLSLTLVAPAFAADHDFSTMNPTVKVTSHKKLFTGQVDAYGSGSGTVITPDGIILTNHHVIFDDEEFKPLDAFEICLSFEGVEDPVCDYTAHLIDHDKDLDVALLKLDPKDVFGQPIPTLKYLDWQTKTNPKEQDKVRVVGYPASGGETITSSEGQISGSETQNGFRYFKTDTDFDHGSSGGTVYDASGNFIGIPTYIRSYAENVGFFLDLMGAQPWIRNNLGKTPQANAEANGILIRELARLSKANESLSLTQDRYPFLSLTLPKGWKFEEITDDSFFANQKNVSDPVQLSVTTNPYQYEVGTAYMKRLDEELSKIKKNYPDYKKETVTFAGQKAWRISYTSGNRQNLTTYVPYGYCLLAFSTTINVDESANQTQALQSVLDTVRLTQPMQSNPKLSPTVRFESPAFSLTAADGWRIQKNPGKNPPDMLAEAVQEGNFDGSLSIYYSPIPKDERQLSATDRLKEKTKNLGGNKLVTKNDQVVLGGLSGILYAYEYEGDTVQETKKHLVILVQDGTYEFDLEYDDLTEHFDANLPAIKRMLDSFSFNGKTTLNKSLHEYGTLGFTFGDIQYHSYAQAISDLADKGLVSGDKNGNFNPENPMARAEALKLILDSKNYLETEKDSGKAVNFKAFTSKGKLPIRDLKPTSPFAPYVRYALEKKIMQGFGDKTFRPNKTITLAETVKLLLNVFEIPVWKGETSPWTKKYMDKGFELGLIPASLRDPNQALTRAETATMVSQMVKRADNQFLFNF